MNVFEIVQSGNVDTLDSFLEFDADKHVNVRNSDDETPLMLAAERGDTDIARLLLRYGADPDAAGKYGFTPLMAAVSSGCVSIVRMLVYRCKSINLKDIYDKTARAYAHDTDIIELLEEHGAVDYRMLEPSDGHNGPDDTDGHIASQLNSIIRIMATYDLDSNEIQKINEALKTAEDILSEKMVNKELDDVMNKMK
jgi:hypothetical protein